MLARTWTVAATVAAAAALGACGGSSSDKSASSAPATASTPVAPATTTPAPTTPTTPATTTPTAATTTPAEPAPPAESSAAVSDAGATLALGKRVVAPYVVYGKTGGTQQNTRLGVTVLHVRKGKLSDFKDFNLDKKQKATVPYYVETKFQNLGKLHLQRFLLDPSIEDTDGTEYKALDLIVLSGTFKTCPEPAKARLLGGQSFTLCAPFLLPKGKKFARVRFQGDVTKDPYFWK